MAVGPIYSSGDKISGYGNGSVIPMRAPVCERVKTLQHDDEMIETDSQR